MANQQLATIEPEPWEKQSHEPEKQYQVFVAYRDMEDRSIPGVARLLERELKVIEAMAVEYNWMARVAAWDNELQRRKRAKEKKEIEAMSKRQAKMGELFQSKAFRRIEAMSDEEAARLPIWIAMRMVEKGMSMERTARGLDAPVGTNVAVNVQQNNGDQTKFGTAAPLAQFLRRNPDKVGDVVDILQQLSNVVGSDTVIDVTPLLVEPEEE